LAGSPSASLPAVSSNKKIMSKQNGFLLILVHGSQISSGVQWLLFTQQIIALLIISFMNCCKGYSLILGLDSEIAAATSTGGVFSPLKNRLD